MFGLENSYFDITSRFGRFYQLWYLGYHGFEAIIQLSIGRNGMRTFNMVSSSYRLSFNESRHSTQLQFQAAWKLDIFSTLSSSTSEASPVGIRVGILTPHAKQRPDLHLSTRAQNGAGTSDESETEDAITNEECSDMELEYISLAKLTGEIRRADLTGDQVFLCCMPRPVVPVVKKVPTRTGPRCAPSACNPR